jgi:hypothetical protein
LFHVLPSCRVACAVQRRWTFASSKIITLLTNKLVYVTVLEHFNLSLHFWCRVAVRADLGHCWAQCKNTFEDLIPKHSAEPKTQGQQCKTLRTKYSRARLKLHPFIRHLVYSVRYSVVPINSSLLGITPHCNTACREVLFDGSSTYSTVELSAECEIWRTGWLATKLYYFICSEYFVWSQCRYL